MSVLPSRLLSLDIKSVNPKTDWTVDDGTGDPWIGFPYQWTVTFTVTAQSHSSHLTKTYQQYNGLDITPGDWIADIATGSAVRVVSISSASPDTVTAVVEDVDRFNTFNDPTQQGTGIFANGQAFCFVIGDDGLPILSPMTTLYIALGANYAWQQDQISRFRYRNYMRSHYSVQQHAHGFNIGDIVRLTPTGYVKATAASFVSNVVGIVSDIGIPGPDWFAFRPVGRVVQNLSPALPGNAGDLIYIAADGTYTTTRPNAFARPVFIQLEVNTKGIAIDRSVDAVNVNGYSSQTYIVGSPALRDAMAPSLNTGDQVKIRDMGNGEWSHFIFEANQTFTSLITQDASATDSYSKQIVVTAISANSGLLATISAGRRVDSVIVSVTTAFDGTPSMSVGTNTNLGQFMAQTENDLTVVGDYHIDPTAILPGPGDTQVNYYFYNTGVTKGSMTITITYS